MKIVQLNCVSGSASTGRTALEMARVTRSLGHENWIFYSEGTSEDDGSFRYITDGERKLHAVLSRLTGLQGYFSAVPTARLIQRMRAIRPDIVHLRVLHGNGICLPMLFRYLKKERIPVVVTLHDCWLFTGKCVYPVQYGCTAFRQDCAHCPAKADVNPSWLFTPARKMHRDRVKWFRALADYRIVGVSHWVSELGKEAFFPAERVSTVYNWIDGALFYPRDTRALRTELGLGGKKVLLGVATRWDMGNKKGLEDFVAIAKQMPEDWHIILAGEMAYTGELPEHMTAVGSIREPERLAELYALADVFVNPSRFETFGKTTAEALMCGTPAIGYRLTAMPELLEGGCGVLVPPEDGPKGLFDACEQILSAGKEAYSENCLRRAREKFGMERNIGAYLALYEELVYNQTIHETDEGMICAE